MPDGLTTDVVHIRSRITETIKSQNAHLYPPPWQQKDSKELGQAVANDLRFA